ncbi:MAG: 5-amino-6-(D-ribitylamino)uracil--L-tyrosine 4-hydroxyphenyl transferase CofH [Nitrososphaerota archaeon]|nr:5-amino-6-(D-ribitylamino)uracil--L-tyrosine 4-hydroxyphenyl transferase CofH [Nitrososphaerota archaeon]
MEVKSVVDRAVAGEDLDEQEVTFLLGLRGPDLNAAAAAADALRKEQVGDVVTYVVNRNINFTNACILRCKFCAFSRNYRSSEAFMLPIEEVVRRAEEAWNLGATEVCIQAGLAPGMDWRLYPKILEQIKARVPNMHIHAYSPEEIWYGSRLSGMNYSDFLRTLMGAGLDSMPGTSAEILDDSIRKIISPGRLPVNEWVKIIKAAHSLGIPTTATMMYGHVENLAQRAEHLLLLRDIQKETGGFTEFVPLSFVPYRTELNSSGVVKWAPTAFETVAIYVAARLALGWHIKNLQVSWVKEGPRLAQAILAAGANDFGGTLINESISTSAGSSHGQFMNPREIRRLILDAGRVPAQRSTTYKIIKHFTEVEDGNPIPLEGAVYSEEKFGSFNELIADKKFRFSRRSP